MIRRLWQHIDAEPPDLVSRGPTGERNEIMRAAWAGHYADRALLLITFVWLGFRFLTWQRIQLRPEAIYEQRIWFGELVFPTLPSPAMWYGVLAIGVVATAACLLKPRVLWMRIVLTVDLLIILLPELGFGHVMHMNYLLVLAHVYSTFRPLGRPLDLEQARYQSSGYSWFLLGLLAVYTASGLWKVVDMTIRDVLKPGVTWLEGAGMLATSIAAMRNSDLPMTIPQLIEAAPWVFPVGYVLLTIVFSASFVAAFRRPLLFIVLPTVVAFHVLNAVVMRVMFLPTIFIAIVVFMPYDFVLPSIRRHLTEPVSRALTGSGADARYERYFGTGDRDVFLGFYAYRERLRDRSAMLAGPLYFPGVAWAVTQVLRMRRKHVREGV